MFYGQCWKCGERSELGTASTCKCPEETSIDWKDYSIPMDKLKTLSLSNINPNYNITFHRDGKEIGVLDFNGPEMVFSGDMNESAKVFFDFIARSFKGRLDQERADERNSWPAEMETMERQVNILTDAMAEQPAQQEPVAAECNFVGTKEWGRCSIEHHNLVQSEPHNWPGYQTRLLYTSPQPAQRKPLTDEQIEEIWADCPVDYDDTVNVMTLARAIEAAHGIKENT